MSENNTKHSPSKLNEPLNEALNIYQKLVKVRESIGYQKKNGKGYGYNYVTESQILLAMSKQMNKQGLFLEQDMIKSEIVEMSIKGKAVSGLSVHFRYIVTNCNNSNEKIERNQFIQHPGCDAQAMGAISTYGMKYFLFKFFNVAMDDHDIDALQKPDARAERTCETEKHISKNQEKLLDTLIGEDQEYKQKVLNFFKADSLAQLPCDQWENILKSAKRYSERKKQSTQEAA